MTDAAGEDLVGRTVFDARGDEIGRLVSLYADTDTDTTLFGGVRTRVHGRRRVVFVSLVDAVVEPRGLTVKCGKGLARTAPCVHSGETLSVDDEPILFAHYELPYRPKGRRVLTLRA